MAGVIRSALFSACDYGQSSRRKKGGKLRLDFLEQGRGVETHIQKVRVQQGEYRAPAKQSDFPR
ncbi:MAG: hypothetical protein ACP5QR_15595 [Rhizomicrobium sp.]